MPSRRILIVDDNEEVADVLTRLLRLDGHDVLAAYGAEDALEQVSAFKPAIVFLDIGLPEMDGYEVARRIRAMSAGSQIKLVALTGYGQAHDKARALDGGFDAHLAKPVARSNMLGALEEQAGHSEG